MALIFKRFEIAEDRCLLALKCRLWQNNKIASRVLKKALLHQGFNALFSKVADQCICPLIQVA